MIILHAAGSKSLGIGNLARTAYLAEYLCELTSVTLLWEADPETAAFFKVSEKINRIAVKSRNDSFRALGGLDTKGSIYISDLTDLATMYEVDISRFGFKKTVHLNDDLGKGYRPDILIDEDPFEKERFHGKEADYFGAGYKIFNKSLLEYRPAKPAVRFDKFLISFGGSDPAGYSEKTADTVGRNRVSGISFILGPLMTKERKDLCRQLAPNCIFYEDVKDMGRVISCHDAVISLGGITAYEAALLGRASIAVEWGHMGYYSSKLHDTGILYAFRDIAELENLFTEKAKYEKILLAVAKKGFEMITGGGGYAVREVIKTLL